MARYGLDWQAIFAPTLQAVSLTMLGILVRTVRGIFLELRQLNGRMLTLEERLHGHIKLDETRFEDLKDLFLTESAHIQGVIRRESTR